DEFLQRDDAITVDPHRLNGRIDHDERQSHALSRLTRSCTSAFLCFRRGEYFDSVGALIESVQHHRHVARNGVGNTLRGKRAANPPHRRPQSPLARKKRARLTQRVAIRRLTSRTPPPRPPPSSGLLS